MFPVSDRVKEILSWYQGESPGVLTNLVRMFNHGRLAGTGKMINYPVDQGFEHGPGRSLLPILQVMTHIIISNWQLIQAATLMRLHWVL